MYRYPPVGQKVLIRYNKTIRSQMPLHDKQGVVVVSSRGTPQNHCVRVDEKLFVVNAGNLMKLSQYQ